MFKKNTTINNESSKKNSQLPLYIPPQIVTYTEAQIAEQIGPAHACSPFECPAAPA